jgi:hypothetical protein
MFGGNADGRAIVNNGLHRLASVPLHRLACGRKHQNDRAQTSKRQGASRPTIEAGLPCRITDVPDIEKESDGPAATYSSSRSRVRQIWAVVMAAFLRIARAAGQNACALPPSPAGPQEQPAFFSSQLALPSTGAFPKLQRYFLLLPVLGVRTNVF